MTLSTSTPLRQKKPDLHKLLQRIVESFTLAILGCWCLIISRLNVFHSLPEELSQKSWFYIDLASLSIMLFGIFSALYYKHQLGPRLKRLSDMGESRW
ncbi:MAG: hypothetical protein LBE27_04795 [Deltaproteobacteria bacterium]|jgi:hypothetical protein|nr:hypothetical protein [Deltaproteobacteria bacterium]